MKFPKSLHAEGWADHIDTAPRASTGAPKKVGIGRPSMAGAKLSASELRMDTPQVTPSMSATPPVRPAVAPRVDVRPTATRPDTTLRRDSHTPWFVAAGGAAVVVAGLGIWAMNRSFDAPSTPPDLVTGSAEAPTQVAAITPEPPPAEDRDVAATETPAATATATPEPTPAEPARVGPPVTTVRPAAETVAKASVPTARPDLVVRADPRSTQSQVPERTTPYLQPQAPVVSAAPAQETQPLAVTPTVTPGTAPIETPPAVIAPATPVQPIPPVVSTSPGTAPLAQAPAQPSPEDSGITVQVRTALASDATLVNVPISVSTDHGVVRLEGQVADAPTRERATVVAASATGVKAVDNRLTVAPAPQVVGQAPVSQ